MLIAHPVSSNLETPKHQLINTRNMRREQPSKSPIYGNMSSTSESKKPVNPQYRYPINAHVFPVYPAD